MQLVFLFSPMRSFQFSITTTINIDKATLWNHITQMKNVNAELMPYAMMTYPKRASELGNNEIPYGQTLFTSLVLLFGFIPADLHCLRFDKIEPGVAFYENSVTATHRFWKHTRSLKDANGKTELTDNLEFQPRIFSLGHALLPFIKVVFKNRHRKLAATFA